MDTEKVERRKRALEDDIEAWITNFTEETGQTVYNVAISSYRSVFKAYPEQPKVEYRVVVSIQGANNGS